MAAGSEQRRRYGQMCGLAAGLDLIGERWTLLIIRELLIAPARFGFLLEHLDGIGPNLLAYRLEKLQEAQLVASCPVPSDRRAKEYFLTERGRALRRVVLELARWGLNTLDEESMASNGSRPEWIMLAIEAMTLDRSLDRDVSECYQFNIDTLLFHIEVRHGIPDVVLGPPPVAPALSVNADSHTMILLGGCLLDPHKAVAQGNLHLEGSQDALTRCLHLLALSS